MTNSEVISLVQFLGEELSFKKPNIKESEELIRNFKKTQKEKEEYKENQKSYSLKELKKILDKKAGLDISTKTRKRDIVYFRKVYSKLGTLMGFTLAAIGKEINQKHDVVLHYSRTCDSIYPEQKIIFNELVLKYNLDKEFLMKDKRIGKFEEIKERQKIIKHINSLLINLNEQKLKFLIEYRIKPFLNANKN